MIGSLKNTRRILGVIFSALVLFGEPAFSASEVKTASDWTVNNNADWTPFPPSANPLGSPNNNCTGASTPPGSWAEFAFPAFSIPVSATLTGIQVRVKYRSAGTNSVQLTKGGTDLVGDAMTVPAQSSQAFCSSTAFVEVGGAGELWNSDVTIADFNVGNVGFRLTQNANTVDIDSVELVAFYSSGSDGNSGGPATIHGEHFLCYDIDPHGDFKDREVKLRDQFGGIEALVYKPVSVCNPVDKNGEGIVDRERHLVCYEIKTKEGRMRNVRIENQFGGQDMMVVYPRTLCLPSVKKVLN